MKPMKKMLHVALVLCGMNAGWVGAQQSAVEQIANRLTIENRAYSGLSFTITDRYTTRHNGVEHIYLSPLINGIKVMNANITAAIGSDGWLIHATHNMPARMAQLQGPAAPIMDVAQAAQTVLNTCAPDLTVAVESGSGPWQLHLTGPGNYSHHSRAELVYWLLPEKGLQLVYSFDVDMPTRKDWWQFLASAINGEIVHKVNWSVSCQYDHIHTQACAATWSQPAQAAFEETLDQVIDGTGYRVLEYPVESPNHGGRSLVNEPALAIASPFGWHDTNGIPGPEHTITRGNNVYAYEDINDTNEPGFSPNGGTELTFDFPFPPGSAPSEYTSASVTNLFYANNYIHDYLYYFGFDEPSGNFQANNYGNGGQGSDWVRAEAQDGGGMNNANFATPPDGQRPRMQMYLWSSSSEMSILTVNSPQSVAGGYTTTGTAAFSAPIPANGITANMALAVDATGSSQLCGDAANTNEISGRIALVDRGGCTFVQKVLNAQIAGAVAVIVINNNPGLTAMGGESFEVVIPAIMMQQSDGNVLKGLINDGTIINATLTPPNSGANLIDGSFDNGIIVHEYVHGLSNRLTGGPASSFCLGNEEQMGEGWSDWYAIMMTVNMDSPNPVYRPMGTFAVAQSITGNGIRPAPYDTSFAVNPFTYANLPNSNISVPHGVGFIFATMLWDLTWALIDQYGYDANIDNATAGNNIAMQLVTDALKLQVCSPGFVDGRDAILLADQINYGGAHQCLIWRVFARRGLGFSASQGSSDSRSDGTAAFDLPLACQLATAPPVAAFAPSTTQTCIGLVSFTDQSTSMPQSWLWNFGDGNTSTQQNPVHQYTAPGTYTVSLTVTNNMGQDFFELEEPITYEVLPEPTAEDAAACAGETIHLTATAVGGVPTWYSNGVNIGSGSPFAFTQGNAPAVLQVTNEADDFEALFVGPVDGTIGSGGNHNTNFIGTVNFTAHEPVVIKSAWVNPSVPGPRTIRMWNAPSAGGTVVQEVTVNIDFTGWGRIPLNFNITTPGQYSIGLNNANLFRNNNGAAYPYQSELITITGSSAGNNLYYYFYDIETDKPVCSSPAISVNVALNGGSTFTYTDAGLTIAFEAALANAPSYNWSFGDGATSTDANPVHTYAGPGTYTVTLSVGDGCTYSEEVTITSTSVADATTGSFALWPNPTQGTVQLQFAPEWNGRAFTVAITDLSGRLVFSASRVAQSETTTLEFGTLANGLYTLSITDVRAERRLQAKVSILK